MSHKAYLALFMDHGSKSPGGKMACVVSAPVNWAFRGTFFSAMHVDLAA